MSRVRGRDTGIELRLRAALRSAGMRGYRLQHGPRRIDVAYVGRRVAVFADGCFWQGCPEHGAALKSNVGYWGPKLRRNAERDREADRELVGAGWVVFRFWEHEIDGDIGNVIGIVREALEWRA